MKQLMLIISSIILSLALTFGAVQNVQASGQVIDGTKLIIDGDTVYLSTDQGESTNSASFSATSKAALGHGEVLIPKLFARNIGEFITKLLRLVVVVAALLVFYYLISAGIDWITSGGDKSKTDKARSKITSAILGMLIVSGSFAFYMFILNYFGIGSIEDLFNLIA